MDTENTTGPSMMKEEPAGGSASPLHEKDKNTVMAVLAYLGPLVIVSYLVGKDNPFVKFHVKQGLVLFAVEVIMWFVAPMFWGLWMLWRAVNILVTLFAILGIVFAIQGKEKQLPIIGKFGNLFPI